MFDIKHLLFLAPLASVAFADLELDRDDVPPPCRDICQPIVDLTRRCDVDLPGSNNDRDEDLLERQCVCTNDSFDVERIAGLCASCFQQNFRTPDNDDDDDDDDDDNNTEWDDDDIREIMRDCGFGTASYSSQLSTAAQTINVVATAPTAVDQLSTTIDRNNNPQPTETNSGNSGGGGSGNSNNDDNDDNNNSNNNNDNNDDNNNNNDPSSTSDNSNADSTSNSDNPDETDFAVPGAVPLAGFSAAAVLGAFGAIAAGGALLL